MADCQKVPDKLKSIGIFMKTAAEHVSRDAVISYYCRLYAVQKGMEIDRKSPECKKYLFDLMDVLDKMKAELKSNDCISSETVGQAHLEEYALKLFVFADKRDRSGDFGQATVKSFYTAGILLDVLGVFGEVSEEIEKCRKYAKWKAIYINQCLKNGEVPHAGPLGEDGAAEAPDLSFFGEAKNNAPSQSVIPNYGFSVPPTNNDFPPPTTTTAPGSRPSSTQQPAARPPSNIPNSEGFAQPHSSARNDPAVNSNYVYDESLKLQPSDYANAAKYCKYAGSALQYQDSKTAVDYLVKALKLLTTGKET